MHVAAPAVEPAPEPEADLVLDSVMMDELAIDLSTATDAGPDPQVVATLARLERFLAAVETARHA
jgi:hypothetical protein